MVVVWFGIYGNRVLQEDQKRRAYVELMSRREEADNNLRKDMFGKVIDQFVAPNKTELDARILNLELLAYNFHESIDLGPLLKRVYVESLTDKRATPKERKRLQKLAQDIVARQVDALQEASCIGTGEVHFKDLMAQGVMAQVIRMKCKQTKELPEKWFNVDVMTNPAVTDLRTQTEVDVALSVRPSEKAGDRERRLEFAVSPFDFPLIDNVRLENRSRVSVAMTRVDNGGVTLSLVYFPGSRTSVKDKPFNDEILRTLEEAAPIRR